MHLILTLSTDPEVRSLIRDGAHKKWHLIRTIWIREKYRTLGTNRYCSEILSRNRKVEFKCTNECKQQDFHSIIHTIKPFRMQHGKKKHKTHSKSENRKPIQARGPPANVIRFDQIPGTDWATSGILVQRSGLQKKPVGSQLRRKKRKGRN